MQHILSLNYQGTPRKNCENIHELFTHILQTGRMSVCFYLIGYVLIIDW